MSITYVPEAPAQAEAIEGVLDRAFGPGRFAKTSERVRERGAVFEPGLSRVALDDGKVVGCCRIWSVRAGGPSLFLGPLAVEPDAQHGGVGAQLVRECIAAARAAGAPAILTIGRAAFFRPLGFALVPEGRILMPGPVDYARFQWLGFSAGALDQLKGAVSAPLAASPA